jgi:hypothetical protein
VTEADFPFEPELEHRLSELQGTDRIRALRDRRLAQLSLEVYQNSRSLNVKQQLEQARLDAQIGMNFDEF